MTNESAKIKILAEIHNRLSEISSYLKSMSVSLIKNEEIKKINVEPVNDWHVKFIGGF